MIKCGNSFFGFILFLLKFQIIWIKILIVITKMEQKLY